MKNLIDYASQDNGTDFRDALYSAIHDKVGAHIEAKKQEIASGLMGQNEAKEDREDEEHYRSRRAKDEKAVPSEESPEEKMARKKLNKEEYELTEASSLTSPHVNYDYGSEQHIKNKVYHGEPEYTTHHKIGNNHYSASTTVNNDGSLDHMIKHNGVKAHEHTKYDDQDGVHHVQTSRIGGGNLMSGKKPTFANTELKKVHDDHNKAVAKHINSYNADTLPKIQEEYESLDELSTKAYQKYTSSATGPYNMERLFKGSPKQAQASAGIKRAAAGIESNKLKELQNHIGSDKETAIAVGNRVKEFLGKSYDHNDDLHRKAASQIHKRLSEEYESLDEISTDLVNKYTDKAQKSYASADTSPEKKANRRAGLMTGYRKLKATAKVPATYGEEYEIDDVLIENTGTYAHYYGTKARGYTVRITDSMQPVGGKVIPVDGKSHAKKVAKEHNAQQWNF